MSESFNNDFKISIIATGTESGTWGTITNSNLEQLVKAIGGFKQITISNTNSHTVTTADNTSDQDFRNLFIELTGTSSGDFTLTLPTIQKPYVVKNNLQHVVTIKTSGQSGGMTLPIGKTTTVYINDTDVVDSVNSLDSLTLNTHLNIGSGGTGVSAAEAGSVLVMNTAETSFIAVSPGPSGNVLTSDGDAFYSASFQSAALSNVIRTNAGGYATNNAQPTVANNGTQSMQSYLASIDSTYPNFTTVGAFNVARDETGITGTRNDSSSVNQMNMHVFKSGEPNNAITPLAVRNNNGTADAMVTTNFVPFVDNTNDIGTSSKRFKQIYATSTTISASDQRLKHSIFPCDLGLSFVNSLTPKKFKMNEGDARITGVDNSPNYMPTYEKIIGSRYHYGLIAQDVKQVLDDNNIDTVDFAGWCLADKDDTTSDQLLRYEEFIAPMMKAIQELSTKVNELESRIQQLES